GQLAEAERTLLRAARLAPAEPEILWHLGELRLQRGDRRGALALFRRARTLGPEEPVRGRIDARLRALRE
ncbi:MAG TPA: hypothetical protein VL172_02670, partial [Kofleriaceae bacterium]|nr:hypothetical protein [Kofleriaceae bacterium]